MQYDGSINIDTRVDTKGMNKGTKSIANQLGGVMKALKGVGAALGLAFSGAAVVNFVKKTLESFDLMSSGVGGKIKELKQSFELFKGAVANAFLAAFAALAPYIIMVVNWLTQMLTTIAQIITALFGVQDAMKGVTKNTKDSAKAAKGALAAFDQINVLSQNKDENAGSAIPLLSIPTDMLEKVQAFKDKLLEFLQPAIDGFKTLYDALKPLGKTIWEDLKWAWDNILVPLGTWVMTDLLPAFLELLAGAADVLNEALIALAPLAQEFFDNFLKPLGEWAGGKIIEFFDWLTEKLHELADWIKENPEKFQAFAVILGVVALAFAIIAGFIWLAVAAMTAWTTITGIATAVAGIFTAVMTVLASPIFIVIGVILLLIGAIVALIVWWPVLELVAKNTLRAIQGAWAGISAWFTKNVTDPLREAFFEVLFNIASAFMTTFQGIKSFLLDIVNDIIGIVNDAISGIAGALGGVTGNMLMDGVGFNGNQGSNGFAPKIPKLATGAVIPPNSEFAAILGDQRSGRNLELPEGLLRQIVREESGGNNGGNITVTFEGTLAALIRELKPRLDYENKRTGNSLVKGGTIS